jgi:hypothetical protein
MTWIGSSQAGSGGGWRTGLVLSLRRGSRSSVPVRDAPGGRSCLLLLRLCRRRPWWLLLMPEEFCRGVGDRCWSAPVARAG